MKKSFITRFAATILAAFTLLITASFCTLSASAADVKTAKPAVVTVASNIFVIPNDHVELAAGTTPAAGGAAYASDSGNQTADAAYTKVVNFFITWLRRIGALVALVGAIMFGLAIKNNDAEQKQQGLLTMVAGFVVWAICMAANLFDLFT